MAGTVIKVDVQERPVVDALNRLLALGLSPRPVLRIIGEHLVASVERRFDTETAPDGKPWQPVSKQTRARKKHPKILTETHRLRSSIVYRVASRDTLEIGTNVVYGAIHQFGGTIQCAAFSSWRNLRLDARGNLVRQGKERRAANLARFAKATHKRVRKVQFTVDAHGITIPARPFLGLSEQDRRTILEDFNYYLGDALRGGTR